MNDFVLQQWEEIGARILDDEFRSLQIEVFKKTVPAEGLITENFEEPIKYASGPRAHTSVAATREEQLHKVAREKEISEQIITTQLELDRMVAEAYEKGREEALVQAIEGNNERFIKMEQQLATALADLTEQDRSEIQVLEENALQLSLNIAHKVIDHAVEINPEYIVKIIRDALGLSGGARIRKVRVSPQDMEFIEVLKVAQSIKEFDGTWHFEADPTIKAGCILESSAGTVDYQLDKAWERIKDKILSIRKK